MVGFGDIRETWLLGQPRIRNLHEERTGRGQHHRPGDRDLLRAVRQHVPADVCRRLVLQTRHQSRRHRVDDHRGIWVNDNCKCLTC